MKATAAARFCWLSITCQRCNNETPHYFIDSGKMICKACKSLARKPDVNREPFELFRERLLRQNKLTYLREFKGIFICKHCDEDIPDADPTDIYYRNVCSACKRVYLRQRRQIEKALGKLKTAKYIRVAIRNEWKSEKLERLLGYTVRELREHLERQFLKGMSWSNMDDWHIDHIIPQSAFDLSDPDQFRACWCLSNLRPLWAADNIAKSAKIEFLV